MTDSKQQKLWQEAQDYLDQFFPKDDNPRQHPTPDKARGHAMVLLGIAQAASAANAQSVAREALGEIHQKVLDSIATLALVPSDHQPKAAMSLMMELRKEIAALKDKQPKGEDGN